MVSIIYVTRVETRNGEMSTNGHKGYIPLPAPQILSLIYPLESFEEWKTMV